MKKTDEKMAGTGSVRKVPLRKLYWELETPVTGPLPIPVEFFGLCGRDISHATCCLRDGAILGQASRCYAHDTPIRPTGSLGMSHSAFQFFFLPPSAFAMHKQAIYIVQAPALEPDPVVLACLNSACALRPPPCTFSTSRPGGVCPVSASFRNLERVCVLYEEVGTRPLTQVHRM